MQVGVFSHPDGFVLIFNSKEAVAQMAEELTRTAQLIEERGISAPHTFHVYTRNEFTKEDAKKVAMAVSRGFFQLMTGLGE